MLFNSLEFCIFLVVVICLYYILPWGWRWKMLLAASCIFYMAFIPVYIHPLQHHPDRLLLRHAHRGRARTPAQAAAACPEYRLHVRGALHLQVLQLLRAHFDGEEGFPLDDPALFADTNHLSTSGRALFTERVADWLARFEIRRVRQSPHGR